MWTSTYWIPTKCCVKSLNILIIPILRGRYFLLPVTAGASHRAHPTSLPPHPQRNRLFCGMPSRCPHILCSCQVLSTHTLKSPVWNRIWRNHFWVSLVENGGDPGALEGNPLTFPIAVKSWVSNWGFPIHLCCFGSCLIFSSCLILL